MGVQRPIDANALIEEIRELLYTENRPSMILNNFSQMCFNSAIELAEIKALEAPTIDAVPVVRCRECKYRGDELKCPMCFDEWDEEDPGFLRIDKTVDDGFCHMGAKMDGGAE